MTCTNACHAGHSCTVLAARRRDRLRQGGGTTAAATERALRIKCAQAGWVRFAGDGPTIARSCTREGPSHPFLFKCTPLLEFPRVRRLVFSLDVSNTCTVVVLRLLVYVRDIAQGSRGFLSRVERGSPHSALTVELLLDVGFSRIHKETNSPFSNTANALTRNVLDTL